MTIKKLLEMEIHEEYMFNHRTVGYDEWLKTFGQDMPEPDDYDKTVQAEKTSLQWKDSTKTKRRIS